jgi:hypothetical protein
LQKISHDGIFRILCSGGDFVAIADNQLGGYARVRNPVDYVAAGNVYMAGLFTFGEGCPQAYQA